MKKTNTEILSDTVLSKLAEAANDRDRSDSVCGSSKLAAFIDGMAHTFTRHGAVSAGPAREPRQSHASILTGMVDKLAAMDEDGSVYNMEPTESKGPDKDEKKRLAKNRIRLRDQMRGARTVSTESANEDGNTE